MSSLLIFSHLYLYCDINKSFTVQIGLPASTTQIVSRGAICSTSVVWTGATLTVLC